MGLVSVLPYSSLAFATWTASPRVDTPLPSKSPSRSLAEQPGYACDCRGGEGEREGGGEGEAEGGGEGDADGGGEGETRTLVQSCQPLSVSA